jgi:hypothetical protein
MNDLTPTATALISRRAGYGEEIVSSLSRQLTASPVSVLARRIYLV